MSTFPRCLLISTEFPPGPGGIGTHAFSLAHGLASRGWGVHVVTPQDYVEADERRDFNRAQAFSVSTLERKPRSLELLGRRVLTPSRAAWKTRPDIVIASGSSALWVGAFIARIARRPFVAIGHGSEFLDSARIRRVFTSRAIRSARLVVAVSNYTARLVIDAGVAEESVTVIYNGADERRFVTGLDTAELRHRLELDGVRVVMTVGQVSERKAQDVVVRAMAQIVAQHPDVVYVIVGLPTCGPEIDALVRDLGIADSVRLVGVVADTDLPLYYNLCDLFVLVSRHTSGGDVEGFGIVVREAALCGKPSVVSAGSGLQEAVCHDVTGLVVPAESPEETAAAMIRLLTDHNLRERMGSAAQAIALESTWERQLDRYDEVLRSVAVAS